MSTPDPNSLKEIDVSRIERSQPTKVDAQPSPEYEAEVDYVEDQREKIEIAGLKQDIAARKVYAALFFLLAALWMAVISVLLFFQGFGQGRLGFKLSDTVLLAAIGSTTANLVGILYVVANYLFPKRGGQ